MNDYSVEESPDTVYKKLIRCAIDNGFSNSIPDINGHWDDWECLLQCAENQLRRLYLPNVAEDKLYELYKMVLHIAPESKKESFVKRSFWSLLLSLQREPLDDVELYMRIHTVNNKYPALKIACAYYYQLMGIETEGILKFLEAMPGPEIEEAKCRIKANESLTDLCKDYLYPHLSTDFQQLKSSGGENSEPSSPVEENEFVIVSDGDFEIDRMTIDLPSNIASLPISPKSSGRNSWMKTVSMNVCATGENTVANSSFKVPCEVSLNNSHGSGGTNIRHSIPIDRITRPQHTFNKPYDLNTSRQTASQSYNTSFVAEPVSSKSRIRSLSGRKDSISESQQSTPSSDALCSTSSSCSSSSRPLYHTTPNKSVSHSSHSQKSGLMRCPVEYQPPIHFSKSKTLVNGTNVTVINGQKYIFLKQLGGGGSCQVFSAFEDSENLTEVAVKCIPLSGVNRDTVELYKSEVESLMKFHNNRHIIQLLNYEIRPDYIYIVLEKGSIDLNEILQDGILSFEEIVVYWKKMLQCVAEIHKRRIIHLDLKPSNFVLVGHHLKLIDLGISRRIVDDRSNITLFNHQGTLNYMSPEQLPDISASPSSKSNDSKIHVTTKSDVWSLGIILHVMVTGHTPWHNVSNNMVARLFAILNYEIKFPLCPLKSLHEVMRLCLNRDASKRPSVEELLSVDYFEMTNGSSSSCTILPDDTTF